MALASEIQTVSPRLFCWQVYEPEVKCDLSCCAVATPSGLLFIDPIGLAQPALAGLLSRFSAAGIVLTNGNHCRDAADYRRKFKVPVFASAGAEKFLEMKPDILLADGELVCGVLRAVALPGAGPGEIALVGDGLVCFGDAVINLPPEGLRLLPSRYCDDRSQLEIALRKLLSYDFDIMTFAHGTPVLGSARLHIELLIA